MQKKKNNKESLGFVFGFKEINQNKNSFNISTKCGTSQKYPKKYEKMKDFYAEEIFSGDCFELFYNNEEYIESFTKELKYILEDPEFYTENFDQRKHYYLEKPTKEQYFALIAFDYSALNFICKNFENESHKEQLLGMTVGQFYQNKNSAELLTIYQEHRNIGEYIYNQELANLSNHFANPKKSKPQ